MRVPIFDLRVLDKNYRDNILKEIDNFLKKGTFFMGDNVKKFEKITSQQLNRNYSIGVSSGSSALYLAIKSLGLKKGDEVITTPLTWIITVNAIASCDLTPVFADVMDDFNIDPNSIKKMITKKTKAILPMHYAGHLCKMKEISKIAKDHNLKIIEDCAQAYGASIDAGRAGSFSEASAFSMNPMKPFGGYGEAGLVTTNNYKIYKKIKILRHAGTRSDPAKVITNSCIEPSLNHKIDEINALLLNLVNKKFKSKITKCNRIAKLYKSNLNNLILHQEIEKNEIHGRYVYPIIVEKRNELKKYLTSKNIETKIFNTPLCYDAPFYKKFKKGKLKTAEYLIKNSLIIPCHENLSEEQVDYTIKTINKFYL